MITALLAAILLLAALNAMQFVAARKQASLLRIMATRLDKLAVSPQHTEKLQLLTPDPALRKLLGSINHLLARSEETRADYARSQLAIKRMLSNISHDLKTPLTVVVGYTETLRQHIAMPPEEQRYMLDKVQAKAQEVLALMNRFFDLAVLESADKELPLSRIMMNDVCERSILAFYETLAAQQLDVQIDLPELPVYALGNEEALERILNNLLSNAIRYGYEGKMVGLALRAEGNDVFIEVKDRGKGIAKPHQELVFERMYTLEDSRNMAYQGSGLGLTITKRLVEMMEGQIELHSLPYEETVFRVKLKRVPS